MLSLILHVLVFICTCSAGVGGWLNENGGCEDGQGSLSVASASSLSLRFRSRVGEVITTARSPRRNNKIEREARQSEAARALLI